MVTGGERLQAESQFYMMVEPLLDKSGEALRSTFATDVPALKMSPRKHLAPARRSSGSKPKRGEIR